MNLLSINIKNFRSIEEITISINEINESKAITLLGINESGKSSFLKAISIHDYTDASLISYPHDYHDPGKPIEITFHYELTEDDCKDLAGELSEMGWRNEAIELLKINSLSITTRIDHLTPKLTRTENIYFQSDELNQFTLDGKSLVFVDPTSEAVQPRIKLTEYFRDHMSGYFWGGSHTSALWKSDSKHLITDGIQIDTFSINPIETSVPLHNCFKLAGYDIENIRQVLEAAKNDSASASNLQDRLSDFVTAHIRKIWPEHKIKIKFQITNGLIQFLVEDEGVKYQAKTTDQRSDGFKQFLSFLLTISADSATKNLYNQLLLLDEPETHLHPEAQEQLMQELIGISKSGNNIVVFATHSNYMIDKDHIERCYKVVKKENKTTTLEEIKPKATSYSEVNFEIFNIPSTDYHNELYGYLEDVSKSKLDTLPKNRKWTDARNGKIKDVSLAEYIRHSIHHPENKLNNKYTKFELIESINTLRALR